MVLRCLLGETSDRTTGLKRLLIGLSESPLQLVS